MMLDGEAMEEGDEFIAEEENEENDYGELEMEIEASENDEVIPK